MPKVLDIKKDIEERKKSGEQYRKTSEEKAADDMFEERKQYLQTVRKNTGIEKIWKAADEAYVPHTSKETVNKKTLVSDDELGWRSKSVQLGSEDDWQEDSVPPTPYIKIQTALGIIIDRNPTAVLTPKGKKFVNNTMLMKYLYEDTWDTAMSKKVMLKPFVFNCAKYGIGVGRTYPLTISRDVRDVLYYDPANPKNNKYESSKYTYFHDVFRESLSPWQVWFDDKAKIGNPFSCNDVIYYKDYDWLEFKRQFGHLKVFDYIKPTERIFDSESRDLKDSELGEAEGNVAKLQERVWFWENLDMDLLFIKTDDGKVLVAEPLPNSPKNKRLSVYSAPWTMRNDTSIYGIGVYEAMRNDHRIYHKVRNMTIDQVLLSIYKEFFYSGTDMLENDGVMKTRPGAGRQVTDAKNIKWNDIPGPGKDAWDAQDYLMGRIDAASGIDKSLEGAITGSTAFEVSQARESALKRMKTPLENISDALEQDGYISCGIIEDFYSVAKIKLLADDKYIEPFMLDMYEREDGENLAEGEDYTKEYKEVNLPIERIEEGGFKEVEEKQFFNLTPDDFPWEGIIKIKGQSIIANSEILERTTTTELANLVYPLFQAPPDIAEKLAREILKAYDKEPEDWLPESWLNPLVPEEAPGTDLFVDPAVAEGSSETVGMPNKKPPVNTVGGTNKVINNLSNSIKSMGQK